MADPNTKDLAWPLFDEIVKRATSTNPWQTGGTYGPDYETLCALLGVPLVLQATVRSGVPALALDVWVSYELRRAGLEPDWVWPRAEHPRVVSRDLLRFIESLPKKTRSELLERLRTGSNNRTTSASANLLGKNYVKQVDVVVSAWETGPEVLISTKRMDSSFGNNAFNRIEESYGDAKNLRLRYPQAACGFLYGLRSTAWDKKPRTKSEVGIAYRIVDLLAKMAFEPDAYHASALIVPEYTRDAPPDADTESEDDDQEEIEPGPVDEEVVEATVVDIDVDARLAELPEVQRRHDLVTEPLDPGRFFKIMIETVLTNTPVSYHQQARALRGNPFGSGVNA